jgi:hypothetical protein
MEGRFGSLVPITGPSGHTQRHLFNEQACSIILSAFSRSRAKQKEREDRINSLQPGYLTSTSRDREIVSHDVASLVGKVQSGDLDPEKALLAYRKKALDAHWKTNFLTEVMISKAQILARECKGSPPYRNARQRERYCRHCRLYVVHRIF